MSSCLDRVLQQVYDVEIDKINKPYLPLASGELSVSTGLALVCLTASAALALGWASSSAPLLCTLGGSLALGIAYSTDLPFLRWKRHPAVAAACILAVRAILVQLGFYLHMAQSLGRPLSLGLGLGAQTGIEGIPAATAAAAVGIATAAAGTAASGGGAVAATAALPAPLLFTVAFMLTFSIVIALFKDVPDVAGDKKVSTAG